MVSFMVVLQVLKDLQWQIINMFNYKIGDLIMKKFFQKIYYNYKCLKDKFNKFSETNQTLIKFGVCLFIFISLILIAKCCC